MSNYNDPIRSTMEEDIFIVPKQICQVISFLNINLQKMKEDLTTAAHVGL